MDTQCTIKNEEKFVIPMPEYATGLMKAIQEKRVTRYAKRIDILGLNTKRAFCIIYGQCNKILLSKNLPVSAPPDIPLPRLRCRPCGGVPGLPQIGPAWGGPGDLKDLPSPTTHRRTGSTRYPFSRHLTTPLAWWGDTRGGRQAAAHSGYNLCTAT